MREFASSDRFRLNANGRVLDAWLVYRCARCEDTYNLPVLERRPVHRVPRALLDALHGNDRETAWRTAFRASSAGVELRVVGVVAPAQVARDVSLALPYPLRARLDRVVALALGCSRREVGRRSEDARALKRPAADGQRLRLRGVD